MSASDDDLGALLSGRGRSHFEALGRLLSRQGRSRFLDALKMHGLSFQERSTLVHELSQAIQAGDLQIDEALDPQFALAAASMHPVLRGLLVDNAPPSSISPEVLIDALGRTTTPGGTAMCDATNGNVMNVSNVLSARACALLRSAVDSDRRLDSDSVDGSPEHQLNLSRSALELLLGEQEACRLWTLPLEYRGRSAIALAPAPASTPASELRERSTALRERARHLRKVGDTEGALESLRSARALAAEANDADLIAPPTADDADEGPCWASSTLKLQEMFVRRYSPGTRPWIPFHPDRYEITVNVALSADVDHSGGRLLGVFGGAVQELLRSEGEATVHSSSLLHAVTRMTGGTRYSLILFFDRKPRHPGESNRWTQE